MEDDPRFPNRNKKRDWEMSALDKPVGADPLAPAGEQAEEVELPVNVYRVVDSAPKSPEDQQREREELYSFRQSIPASQQAKVVPPGFTPIIDTPTFHAPVIEAPPTPEPGPKEGVRKFFDRQTKLFAMIGVGLGVLIAIIVGSLTWFYGTPNGRYDLGTADSSAAGLKGRLYVEWDKKLDYRLTIEPSDSSRLPAFAATVAHAPHPLAVEIHLQNSEGFALCSKEILLKYDARNSALVAEPTPEAQAGKTDAATASSPQPAQGIDLAQADAQEAAREKDRDLFKNEVGADGQITSLSAQGTIPCTAKNYEKAVSWSFSPSFPAIAEQDGLLELASGTHPSADTPAAHKKGAAKPAQKLLPFSVEGDDAIVDFDASRGIIETSAGKVFYIDKSGGAASSSKWQDYPVEIHYRCDRGSDCILMHSGAGALHVRLRR